MVLVLEIPLKAELFDNCIIAKLRFGFLFKGHNLIIFFITLMRERICGENPCFVPCWAEWKEWNTCSKSCDGGIKRRERAQNLNATQSQCILSEVVQCNTHLCSGRNSLVLISGGRGHYMTESSVINVNLGSEKRKIQYGSSTLQKLPKFTMHCSETLKQKAYFIGGYYTRKYIHSIGLAHVN